MEAGRPPTSPESLRFRVPPGTRLGLAVGVAVPWISFVLAVRSGNALLAWSMGAVAAAITIALAWILVGGARRYRHLRAHGVEVVGSVLLVEPSEGLWSVLVGYTAGGGEHRLRRMSFARPAFAPGDPVSVVVDPRKPSIVAVPELGP